MMPIPPAPPLPEAIEAYVKKYYFKPKGHYQKVYDLLDVPPAPLPPKSPEAQSPTEPQAPKHKH